ncbi:hypothetical protein DFP72DRAFT_550441 [Ephemerocybe angulata]|uniref:Uncharacterized protein n=1 Tax=Ephemerocybe angulata TaxID=980116 RepID=A0A8H6M0L7_9AGAR|nr:hypothetical protein DFP72DRAFT_550441 [Tulosesus angulatus]
MALNWAMLNPNRTAVPLPGEMTIMSIDSGVDLQLTIPTVPPIEPTASSGGSGGFQKMHAQGRIWLTDQRFIFVSVPNSPFESLSVQLHAILSTGFHQPTFGSNYCTFELKPSPEGNLTDGTSVEVRFKDRPMFEFVSHLEKSRERAIYMRKQMAEDEEGLPTYTMPEQSSSVTMVGQVPVENPPGYEFS